MMADVEGQRMGDAALVRAHEALAFLGAAKMLELSAFELSVAISAAEVWASGERPTDARVAHLLDAPANQLGVVGRVLARLWHLGPAWTEAT
jgi:hypothetical protein